MKPGPISVDWVHPSVRDTVIEYLMEHDSHRQRFLRTARASGALTALSTGGGPQGTLTRPLLRTSADWQALRATVERIGADNDTSQHYVLLQGIDEALRTSHTNEEASTAVKDLVRDLLTALQSNWSQRPNGIPASALKIFYDLSVRIGELVPSPDLSATWKHALLLAESALNKELDYNGLQSIDEWIRLVGILESNEPRFLLIQESHTGVEAHIYRVIDWIKNWSDGLSELAEYEFYMIETPNGAEVEEPVKPDSSEEDERFLLNKTEDVVSMAIDFTARTATPGAKGWVGLLGVLEEQRSVRETRQERYDEWDSSMKGDDRNSWSTARSQGSGDFDIVEFFSDL